jgi:hypothetical protein
MKDSALGGNIVIGRHYVATISSSSAQLSDVDLDGIPDFAEDENGNGQHDSKETHYDVEDLDPVRFVGLTGGTLGPGKVRIDLQVTNKLDNLTLVALTVDGFPIPGTESLAPPYVLPLSFEVDTSRLANGIHALQAEATWPHLVDGATDPSITIACEPIEVTVNNEISFPDWRHGFGPDAQGQVTVWVPAQSAHTDVDYRVDLVDPYNGEYVGSATGSCAIDGAIDASWVDSSYEGTAYRPIVTTFTLGQNPTQVGRSRAPLKQKPIENWPPNTEGKWVVAYQAVELPLQNFWMLDGAMTGIAGAGQQAGGLVPQPGTPPYLTLQFGFQQAPREAREAQWKLLLDSLANYSVRNFYYGGHGSGKGLGEDIRVYVEDVSKILHTDRFDDPERHPYRFVFLDGCKTASGSWMGVFGIPMFTGQDLNSYLKHNERPAAFVGWSKSVFFSESASQFLKVHKDDRGSLFRAREYLYYDSGSLEPDFANFRSQFIWYWTGSLGAFTALDLSAALALAYEDTNDSGVDVAWEEGDGLALYGYKTLRWKQFNHTDWQTEARNLLGQ